MVGILVFQFGVVVWGRIRGLPNGFPSHEISGDGGDLVLTGTFQYIRLSIKVVALSAIGVILCVPIHPRGTYDYP